MLKREEVSAFEAVVYNPVVCLILQGSKIVTVGTTTTTLAPGDALVVSHDLPVQSRITLATPASPYIALIINLDLGLIRGLYEQVAGHLDAPPDARSMSAGAATPDVIDAIARYLDLVRRPLDADVLGPAVLREIHYRLLMSPMGGMLRRLLSVDSHASRVSRAILKLRSEFRDSVRVADLAREAGMSQSAFHGHFKSVTGTTPLQYQKELRMIAAHELLVSGRHSVSGASFEVGYESPTHFSRDFQRKFGVSPSRVEQATATAA